MTKTKLEDEVDALYRLPLTEFTAARNTLAAQLKKDKRSNEADFVKGLGKPSVTAWAVNQLYWDHRDAFDRLIATGGRFRQAQTSRSANKVADMRGALDARRQSLSEVSDLAAALMRAAGHNPTPDTMLRVTATLEALSVYASTPDGPHPGRLTQDVDPPGFESLTSLIPGSSVTERTKEPPQPARSESGRAAANTRQKAESAATARQLKDSRQAIIAAAKTSVQEAKAALIEARARAQRLEVAQKKAHIDAKNAEKNRREAEERFEEARVASEEAAQHARSVAAQAKEALKEVDDAKREVEKASRGLEKL